MAAEVARPLLILPQPQIVSRRASPGRSQGFHRPSEERQEQRLTPQFAALEQAFATEQARLAQVAPGAVPEQVLVLETVGTVPDFYKALQGIPGMAWLGAWDEDSLEPDDDFYRDDGHQDALLAGQLLLILNNQQALQQLLALWDRHRTDPTGTWERGRTKWRDLFRHLHTIRPWDAQDRLRGTGLLEDWQSRVTAEARRVRIEVELWFRSAVQDRSTSEALLVRLLHAEGGTVVNRSVLAEIAYHGVLAELPIDAVGAMVQQKNTQLVRCEQVMFFRPTGQVVARVAQNASPLRRPLPAGVPLPQGEPVAALLDGVPLANHEWLADRLILDDPDGWETAYRAGEQVHGTAMASLIIHGELDAHEGPLARPLYVRPILQPNFQDFHQVREELIPEDILTVDLIHRAVRRIFERVGNEGPAAPSVRIINLSVGDASRPFDRFPSPWARLVDWLSWRYRVLFIVSAGNYSHDIELTMPPASYMGLPATDLEQATLRAIAATAEKRTIIAPSEAINALTVGALHEDASGSAVMGQRIDLMQSRGMPSPISRMGPGFHRAIKPDILAAGGRQTFMSKLGAGVNQTFSVSNAIGAPGQAVATPGPARGDITGVQYMRGTSNAAALTTRTAVQLHDMLEKRRLQPDGAALHKRYTPVLLKALLAHSASWGATTATLRSTMSAQLLTHRYKDHLARFLGYGSVDVERVFKCTDQRVTLLGCGEFNTDGAHCFSLALPAGLVSQKVRRRLTITLAWLTPINAGNNKYRYAALSVDPLNAREILQVARLDADWQAARRGTLQHEVLEGTKATAYGTDATIELMVSCRCLSPARTEIIPYALAVTLEVPEDVPIPIYDEVEALIRPRIPLPVPIISSP